MTAFSGCADNGTAEATHGSASTSAQYKHQFVPYRDPPHFFETAGGEIAIRQSPEYGMHSLWWHGQMLLKDDHLSIVQTYPENHGKPAILIVNRSGGGSIDGDGYLYVIDMGTTPPYIAPHALPIAVDYTIATETTRRTAKHHQLKMAGLKIKKIDTNTYSFSGKKLNVNALPLPEKFFKPNSQGPNSKDITFIYSRIKRTIEEKH